MHIDDSEGLNEFLKSVLGRMCSADPAALARYILALLKKRSEAEVKPFLLNKLQIFLSDQTAAFVEILINALSTKCYLTSLQNPAKENENFNGDSLTSNAYKKESKELCRDYVEKGFCLNGNYCQKSHDHPIVVENVPGLLYSPALPSTSNAKPPSPPPPPSVPEYNPEFPDMEYLDIPPSKRLRQNITVPLLPNEPSIKRRQNIIVPLQPSEPSSKRKQNITTPFRTNKQTSESFDLNQAPVKNVFKKDNLKSNFVKQKKLLRSISWNMDPVAEENRPYETTFRKRSIIPEENKEKKKLNIMKAKLKQQEILIAACIAKQKSLLEKLANHKNGSNAKSVKKQLFKLAEQTRKLQEELKKGSENLKLRYLSSDLCSASNNEVPKPYIDFYSDLCAKGKSNTPSTISPCLNTQEVPTFIDDEDEDEEECSEARSWRR